ncbi:MobB family relaxase [Aureibaculum sp. 2210JD6-5]|uniref:MobB family relaxase n=1 Tax=Aureibaculum sp. 2210JD6-5 TaxID=3103957 RepID=UPI002AAC8986|nr:MobB family relaxase [Aureibaculum sp. 2210JD6-5]MDY7396853.1 MobB family relaxase [Aureibaculum sp. 2210JD6-5]
MYIAITKQQSGMNYKGSVSDFVNYLEKENEDKSMELQEHFFDQYNDKVSPEEVISEIDGNTAKLSKKDPKFYSLVVSPSPRELKHINNNPEKLRKYVREIMKDYADAFYRDQKVTVDDIKYYAKLEHERTYKGTDKKIQENQPYATKILQLKNEIRDIQDGTSTGNIKKLKRKIAKLEKEAPHQQQGKRIVRGMQKEGFQSHIHIIVSRKDSTNSFSLSPGSKYKESETILNGKKVKQGFHREKFYKASEKKFDSIFGYNRNFVESYWAKIMFIKDPKQFFATLVGLPTTERQMALTLLHKTGINVPNIPTNKVQLAYKAFMKLKKGMGKAINSGSIGI